MVRNYISNLIKATTGGCALVALLITSGRSQGIDLLSGSGIVRHSASRRQKLPLPDLDKQIELKTAGDLPSAMRALSEASRISIIAEGSPNPRQANLTVKSTVRQALDKICDAYDYRWAETSGGIVLLTRRFSLPGEIPQMNLAEIRQAAADMLTILPACDVDLARPHRIWGEMLQRISDGLSSEQVTALRNHSTLPFAKLTPQQQAAVSATINARVYGAPRAYWYRLYLLLGGAGSASIHSNDYSATVRHISLTGPRKDGGPVQLRLGEMPRGEVGAVETERRSSAPSLVMSKEEVKSSIDTKRISDHPLDRHVTLFKDSATLRHIASEIARQCGTHMETTAAISGHKVHAFLTDVPCRAVLDSLCVLGNWVWRPTETDHYLLTRPTARAQREPEQVAKAMQKALPRDLLDYLGLIDWGKRSPEDRQAIHMTHLDTSNVEAARLYITDAITPRFRTDSSILLDALPSDTQNRIAFVAFYDRFTDGSAPLYNALDVQVIVIERCYLSLEHDEILMVQMLLRPNYPAGFGANVVNR